MEDEPLASDGFESVLDFLDERELLGFALPAGIDVGGELLADFVELVASVLQANVGVHAQRDAFLFAGEAVFESPAAATAGRDFEVQTSSIEKLVRLGLWLGVFDLQTCEGHGGNWRFDAPFWGQLQSKLPPTYPRLSTWGRPAA